MQYEEFLQNKTVLDSPTGIQYPHQLNGQLFDFQRDIVRWALRRGRAAIFADCGMGKTAMQLEWANRVSEYTGGNVLILAPLAVSSQTVREGAKFGIDIRYCRNQSQVEPGITITNYEMLPHFNPDDFAGVVLDECFPPETPIDVFSIDNVLTCRYIKDVRKGDRIFNASGEDHVQNIYKRRIDRAVKISINGHNVTCSENHPWFTVHGWRSAQDLRTGDNVMATSEAVRLVRGGVQAEARSSENAKVLRSILLSEMAHEHTGAQGKGSHSRSGSEEGRSPFQMVEEWEPTIDCRNGAYNQPQPNGRPFDEGEAIIDIAEDGSQTFRAWGQWTSDDITSAINDGCVVRQLDTGICYITGETSTRFSDMLQSRLRESRLENSDRVGRSYASDTEGEGRKEGCETGFFRVDSVEILELGHPDLEQYRDENGDIYFYDIKASRHPSFSVNGCLVHNSSILKSYTGKFRTETIDAFKDTPFRLACTATPAPNDHMELGNHAEFLGVMSRVEMLSMFFVHDGGETQKWRIKGHAEGDFWRWVASWAVMIRKPSDIGYSDDGFILPSMEIIHHVVKKDEAPDGFLFPVEALTLQERQQERKSTVSQRAELAAQIANETDGPCLVWCNLNDESSAAKALIDGAVEVKGSDKSEHKESAMLGFSDGAFRVMVTKPSIAGFGMNWQHCNTMVFLGLSDSYEQFYQAVRRCWRFGQKNKVTVHVVTAETEGAVVKNIERKEVDAMTMAEGMVKHMADINADDIHGVTRQKVDYARSVEHSDNWTLYHGDCVDVTREMPDNSVGFSIFSPPFSSLYTYSASDRDMGNCKTDQEFADHFRFLVPELLRITKPGRLCAFHCMNLPTSKNRDGVIGIKDFRGQLIKTFQDAGWIYHSEVVIWKDPVTAMQRTKALGLLHKQLKKDSCMSRQGIPDYLVVMRKPGENPEPVCGELEYFAGDQASFQQTKNMSIDVWQRYASPVWMDINPSNTLQRTSARDEKDERHICPLQLDVIERALQLWTNPADTVFSPFAGIGSEGYQSLKMGRKFIGIELKDSYFRQAVKNLREADSNTAQQMSLLA